MAAVGIACLHRLEIGPEAGSDGSLVDAGNGPVDHRVAPVGDYRADVGASAVHVQGPDRVLNGADAGVVEVDDDHVGLGADGEAAEIVASERPGAAERGGTVEVGGAGGIEAALDQLRDVGAD